jgi:hypothetical protein
MEDTQVKPVKYKPRKNPRRRAGDKVGKPRGRAAGCLGAVLNLLALAFVLLSGLAAALVALLFVFSGVLAFVPGGSAYMPATEPAIPAIALVLSSPTGPAGTPDVRFPTLPPVWTPSNTPTISPTPAPGTATAIPSGTIAVPTYTSTPTLTPTSTATKPSPTPTRTGPTPTRTATRSVFAYTLQNGSPTYLANFLNTPACNWFGIVGRAFGLDNNPVINLTVHLEGGGINTDVLTGTGPSALGVGSYQIPISDHPIDTTDVYHIVLRYNTGTAASEAYAIRTYGDCTKNLVMVNFVQNHVQ